MALAACFLGAKDPEASSSFLNTGLIPFVCVVMMYYIAQSYTIAIAGNKPQAFYYACKASGLRLARPDPSAFFLLPAALFYLV